MLVLVLNAGSSSLKCHLYQIDRSSFKTPIEPLWSAHLDQTKTAGESTITTNSSGIKQCLTVSNRDLALEILLDTLKEGKTKIIDSLDEIELVAHRVVHGGAKYNRPTVINTEVKKAIASLIPLAPNHNRAHLKVIETIERLLPKVPQIAVFDTAFHTTLPQAVKVYPLPYEWYERGIQRYGFHGISHQYCAQRAATILKRSLSSLKIVTCHLGNGCSLAAIDNGRCIDTTMGFSPLEGLMMGTRCGSIDPQILVYLQQNYNLDVTQIDRLLNSASGLLGVSGISSDLRNVVAAMEKGNERAVLALEIYIHRLRGAIGAMVSSLNGLDVLVFTAGVGENSALVRQKTCQGLSYLGLQLDSAKNNTPVTDANIAFEDSLPVLVIQTRENWAIAKLAVGIAQQAIKITDQNL